MQRNCPKINETDWNGQSWHLLAAPSLAGDVVFADSACGSFTFMSRILRAPKHGEKHRPKLVTNQTKTWSPAFFCRKFWETQKATCKFSHAGRFQYFQEKGARTMLYSFVFSALKPQIPFKTVRQKLPSKLGGLKEIWVNIPPKASPSRLLMVASSFTS